jgi:hypothetical protein
MPAPSRGLARQQLLRHELVEVLRINVLYLLGLATSLLLPGA